MFNWQNSSPSGVSGYPMHTGHPSPIVSFANAIYYPNYKVYNGQTPSTLNLGFVSHVLYAFAWPNDNGTISLSDDYADNEIEADGVHGAMHALTNMKHQYPHLKILLSIGGGGEGSTHFPTAARTDSSRHAFAKSAKHLIDIHGFDGIDIDWEHPSNSTEGASFLSLLTSLRHYLPRPHYTLTTALPAGAWALQNIPLAASVQQLDYLNLMAYDFYGPWTETSGHQAQLFAAPHSSDASGASGVYFALQAGVPAKKILLGIPAYGRSFLGVNGPGQRYTGQGGNEGAFEYKDLPRHKAHEAIDHGRVAAWCLGGDGGWVSYDNPATVRIKASWARQMRLGGLFYWSGTGDRSGHRSLVEAGYNELHEQ